MARAGCRPRLCGPRVHTQSLTMTIACCVPSGSLPASITALRLASFSQRNLLSGGSSGRAVNRTMDPKVPRKASVNHNFPGLTQIFLPLVGFPSWRNGQLWELNSDINQKEEKESDFPNTPPSTFLIIDLNYVHLV